MPYNGMFTRFILEDYAESPESNLPSVPTIGGLDDETMEKPWPDNPVVGAQELPRFFRVRELLQQ